mmetsp:Transcript_8149/g.50474  ORF Transcript_8149/g.50474 Transcript_8149/m.50474 type:complete len:84 (-) Transcript_8149:1323-1574(-)
MIAQTRNLQKNQRLSQSAKTNQSPILDIPASNINLGAAAINNGSRTEDIARILAGHAVVLPKRLLVHLQASSLRQGLRKSCRE